MTEEDKQPVMTPVKVLLKRGTREQNDNYIGQPGEITLVVPDPQPTEDTE